MTIHIPSLFPRLLLSAALICFAGYGAVAQEVAPAQQLPDSLVDQQIPPAFPQEGAAAPATTDANASPDTAEKKEADLAPSASDPAAITAQDPAATTPVPSDIPAQPEQKRLVPATPMGAAAQNVEAGQGAAGASEAAPNPVEDAASAAETSGLPDALEQYADRAAENAGDAADSGGDALPAVNDLNMVKLEGDFDNSLGKATVGIDGDPSRPDPRLQEEIRTEAFDAAITGMFPLSPDQIQTLLKKYDSTQKVVTSPPYDAPKPEISVQNISLDPGVVPPTIKTAVGNVTTINMLDATGAPWPVQDVTWAGDFEIVEPEEGGHIVRITPMGQFARGNIVIRMLTLKTPITMTLETARDVVQYRIDARIPEYGPFASAPLMQGAKSTMVAGSSDLTSLLDGVMPGGMQKLEVSGVDGRTTAYTMNGTTYVRTPLTLLSPAWQSSVSSADGMNVYALSNAPVVLLSDGGEFQRAVLKEKEDLLDE